METREELKVSNARPKEDDFSAWRMLSLIQYQLSQLCALMICGRGRIDRLLITKDEYPPVTSVELEQDALELAQGEMAVLRYRTTPSPAKVNQVVYESEDKNVVTTDEYGVLIYIPDKGIRKLQPLSQRRLAALQYR